MPRSAHTVGERLSSRLIATFVAIILATTIAAGALAYWLTHTELEQQARGRLQDGRRATLALLDADRMRLDNLVILVAQRPALQELLRDEDTTGLGDYVTQLRASADLDVLTIYDADRQLLTGDEVASPCGPPRARLAATFCLLPVSPPHVALLGGQAIVDAGNGELLGFVMMAIFLDDAYQQELAQQTGVEQSIVIDGSRIATSLTEAGPPVATTNVTGTLSLAGEEYVTLLWPLPAANGESVAHAEVALPITALKETERRILLTLIASTLLIAVAGSVSAVILRKNISDAAVQHLRTHFLANITHEFRTPLSALRASVEYLADEMADLSREEINALLHAIHMSVTRLQTLVDNLLESISIEAGHFTIRPEPIELDDVLDEATRVMQPLLHRRQQKLALSAPDVIPLVYADAARLTQVLVNLLANASKYGPIGQTIDLEVQSAGDGQVRVAVADRGPGLSPAIREKLFRRFGRVEVVDGAEHGVGLGLWVVKVIVSEHGGTVGADERPGGGAVFWFTVPTLPQPKRA